MEALLLRRAWGWAVVYFLAVWAADRLLDFIVAWIAGNVTWATLATPAPWGVWALALVAGLVGFLVPGWPARSWHFLAGLLEPRTFKAEIVRLIRQVRALVAEAKACKDINSTRATLTTSKAYAVMQHAHAVKIALRDLLHTPEATRELTALETWPDDALAHTADTFARLLPQVDPTIPALSREQRNGGTF